MLITPHQTLLSFLWASYSVVLALPAESPADALAKLEGRAQCNADNCYGALTNRAASATPFCTDYISKVPGTVTVTKWASSTITPATPTITTYVGTTTISASVLETATTTQTQFEKRAVTTPIASILTSSCTAKVNAPITSRISSACTCLLSTSVTTTITSTMSITLSTPAAITETTSYATTSTIDIPFSTTTVVSMQTEAATCPEVNGGFLSDADDTYWSTFCNWFWYYDSSNYMYATVTFSFKSCVELCAADSSCQLVDFERATNTCTLLSNTHWNGVSNYEANEAFDGAGGEF